MSTDPLNPYSRQLTTSYDITPETRTATKIEVQMANLQLFSSANLRVLFYDASNNIIKADYLTLDNSTDNYEYTDANNHVTNFNNVSEYFMAFVQKKYEQLNNSSTQPSLEFSVEPNA